MSKIVISNMLPFCKQDFRYFIGYKDDYCTFMDILSKSECIQNKYILIKLNVCIL